jgi:hypothetical protein
MSSRRLEESHAPVPSGDQPIETFARGLSMLCGFAPLHHRHFGGCSRRHSGSPSRDARLIRLVRQGESVVAALDRRSAAAFTGLTSPFRLRGS